MCMDNYLAIHTLSPDVSIHGPSFGILDWSFSDFAAKLCVCFHACYVSGFATNLFISLSLSRSLALALALALALYIYSYLQIKHAHVFAWMESNLQTDTEIHIPMHTVMDLGYLCWLSGMAMRLFSLFLRGTKSRMCQNG